MKIKEIKEQFEIITNKYQDGSFNGDEFNILFRKAEMSYLNFLIGNLHIPTKTGLGINKQVIEKLAPFRKTVSGTIGIDGSMSKPNNISIVEGMNKKTGQSIRLVPANKIDGYVNSSVYDVNNNPIYTEYDTYWRFYPESLGEVVATVIQHPPPSKWAYTMVSDREVYDDTNSVDPLWKENDIEEIVGRMMKATGVSLKDPEITQFGQSVTQTGE